MGESGRRRHSGGEIDTLRLCAELARLNGVADRVAIHGACDTDRLRGLPLEHALLFMDCEGCEKELLRPDLIPALRTCTILVELHDFRDPTISPTLLSRFAASHDITVIKGAPRDPAAYPALAHLPRRGRWRALDEMRPERMDWAFMTPKHAPPEGR